jgi:hypothetical protein
MYEAKKHILGYEADQWGKLVTAIQQADSGDKLAVDQIIESVAQDRVHAGKALVNFMEGVSIGTNPTLAQIQFNQQLTNALFKHIADYLVRD